MQVENDGPGGRSHGVVSGSVRRGLPISGVPSRGGVSRWKPTDGRSRLPIRNLYTACARKPPVTTGLALFKRDRITVLLKPGSQGAILKTDSL